jgi:hypothetical protein
MKIGRCSSMMCAILLMNIPATWMELSNLGAVHLNLGMCTVSYIIHYPGIRFTSQAYPVIFMAGFKLGHPITEERKWRAQRTLLQPLDSASVELAATHCQSAGSPSSRWRYSNDI